MIKVIIADDHKLIRDGLKAMLTESEKNFQITGEASSGKELIGLLPETEADVVLMDLDMPEMNGLEATVYLKEHFPDIKVLILSMMENENYVSEAIKAGALGYILKTTDQKELVHAIHTVAQGDEYISTQIALKMLKNLRNTQGAITSITPEGAVYTANKATETPGNISKREMEVLRLIAQGHTNAEIADMLFTSKRTVESHRQNLLEKTGSKNTASLIVYASKHHLLPDDGATSARG